MTGGASDPAIDRANAAEAPTPTSEFMFGAPFAKALNPSRMIPAPGPARASAAMAPPTQGCPSAVSSSPCAYSCRPKWCRWWVVWVTRQRPVSPHALYRSHFVRSISSARRASALIAASSAARPTGRGDIVNPLSPTALVNSATVDSDAPSTSSTAAVSVTRFTAARDTPGVALSTFCTAAEHPPHLMPSTVKRIVEPSFSSS
mmetsp:Transcript_7689/g.34829  ORF Transcript_7689/g.34829 Transcript_7689/m.34829 type:complete len:203 (+) Transcript_7689:3362-3970(+)